MKGVVGVESFSVGGIFITFRAAIHFENYLRQVAHVGERTYQFNAPGIPPCEWDPGRGKERDSRELELGFTHKHNGQRVRALVTISGLYVLTIDHVG